MHEFFKAYDGLLQIQHKSVTEAIGDLTVQALDWVPGPGMNSLGALVVHLTGAQRYMIGDMVGQDPLGEARLNEFEVQGLDAAELQKRLDQTLAHSQGVLSQLTLEDLDQMRYSPRGKRNYSVAWTLAHALEHNSLHLGHIQIGRELWQQESQQGD